MSSSTKKQLRREQVAAKKAQEQQTAKQESKRVKLYTSIFCVILALMVLLVAVVGVNNSGLIEPRITAVKVGDTEINAAELNVYYINSILEFYESAGSYLPLYGLQAENPLNSHTSMDTVNTWDNYFIASAEETLHYYYSLYNAALADDNYTEAEQVLANVRDTMELMESSYANSGVKLNDNLRTRYGRGVNKSVYQKVLEVSTLASEYYTNYADSLTYTADDIAAHDAKDPVANNLYNYAVYVLYTDDFLEGGSEDENGAIVYSDEEKAAALAACEAAAKLLSAGNPASAEALEQHGESLPIHDNDKAASTMVHHHDQRATGIAANLKEWVTDSARQPGDVTYIERTSTVNGETAVSGYDVVYCESIEDNEYPLVNVRHILVSFEGGTTDPETGVTTYTQEEKDAAKAKADEIHNAWQSGEATAESFAALAEEKSGDTGSKANGGLYTDVYPGQMVAAFNNWCFEEGRKIGDHEVVETEYGYHIMYLDGFSETTYRDFIVTNDLKNADLTAWQTALLEKYPLTEVNLSRVDRTLVLANYLYYGYGA